MSDQPTRQLRLPRKKEGESYIGYGYRTGIFTPESEKGIRLALSKGVPEEEIFRTGVIAHVQTVDGLNKLRGNRGMRGAMTYENALSPTPTPDYSSWG